VKIVVNELKVYKQSTFTKFDVENSTGVVEGSFGSTTAATCS
jgi:hypothetical protein